MRRVFLVVGFLLACGPLQYAHAHTTVEVEQYSIEVGWGIEPPVAGHRNQIVFDIAERGESSGVTAGVKNAFQNLDATVKFGGAGKPLDISADVRAGHYFSDIIPTRTGTYSVEIAGSLGGVPVSVDVPIEDAEGTAILDFPPRSGGGSEDLGPVKQALSELQREIAGIKEGGVAAPGPAAGAGTAYDLAVFGLSLGAAGVILAVVAMVKRK